MNVESNIRMGWCTTSLEAIANWGSGGTPSRNIDRYFQGLIPWIKTGELGQKYIRDSEEKITDEAVSKSSAKIFPKGSVAIAMYGATIGKVSIFGIDASTNQACAVGIPSEAIHNEFLYYFLLSEKQNLIKAGKGGAQPNLSQGIIKDWSICLSPLAEQHRIVAKIEELFSELDKGVDNLKTARAQLKVYRQALLKHAFEGKLTTQWRLDNQDKLESASDLQKRIQLERTQRDQQQLQAWKSPSIPLLQRGKTVNSAVTKNAEISPVPPFEKEGLGKVARTLQSALVSIPPFEKGGLGKVARALQSALVSIHPFEKGGLGGISPGNKPGSKPKAPKTLPPLTAEELAELPSLPNGWGWAKFGEIFNVYVGATPSRARNDFWNGDIPWVSSGEVAFCRIKKTKEKITSSGYQNTSTEIHPVVTILLAMIGEGKTRGQAAMLDIEAAHNQNTAAIRVSESGCSSNFVYQYLVYQYETTRKIGGGNNQKALNKDRVSDLTLPLCSIVEMNAVSEYLDEKLSVTDQLEQTITTALQQAEALRQSILKKAFSGQLVPQDPDDEPASALLARIKADKLLQEQASKKPLTKGKRHE